MTAAWMGPRALRPAPVGLVGAFEWTGTGDASLARCARNVGADVVAAPFDVTTVFRCGGIHLLSGVVRWTLHVPPVAEERGHVPESRPPRPEQPLPVIGEHVLIGWRAIDSGRVFQS